MEEKSFDFEAFVKQAGEQLRSGKPLAGADGVFTPLLKRVIEASPEGELDQHLQLADKQEKNRRNGHTRKNIQSSLGGFDIFSPRDRNSTFEPQTVARRRRVIPEDMDKKILGLYGMGLHNQTFSTGCWRVSMPWCGWTAPSGPEPFIPCRALPQRAERK